MNSISEKDSKPQFFLLLRAADRERFEELRSTGAIRHVVDEYRSQLSELYVIEHPQEVFASDLQEKTTASIDFLEKKGPLKNHGTWVYFPWLSVAVHILPDTDFQKVRMARNRNLITEAEQKKFYDARVGVAGLSVGNSVALAIALQGGVRRMKLADHDTLELSNLNRIRTGVQSLGLSKVEMTARQIYELNPYAEIELFPEGITDQTIGNFFEDLDIVVDEMDNLAMKYRIRQEAKKRRLPIITAADNDKSGVLDIERYDLNPETLPFHGSLKTLSHADLAALDKKGIGRKIAQLIGLENHTERMLLSLQEIGKSLVSWPQLGGTAFLNGALVAYAVLRIANGSPLIAGRAIVALDKELDGDYDSSERKKVRDAAIRTFREILGL